MIPGAPVLNLNERYIRINDRVVQRVSDHAFIPVDPDNLDYAAVLLWLAAGKCLEPRTDL